MKSNLTKVSLALVSVVFILGCQDLGTGVVASEGLGPQFAKKNKPRGGGGNGKDLGATFTTHTHTTHTHTGGSGDNFVPVHPTITTTEPSPGLVCGCTVTLVTSIPWTGSELPLDRMIGLTIKVKSGKVQSVRVWVDDEVAGGAGKTPTILVDPPLAISGTETTIIHLHADNLELTNKRVSGVMGTISIADVVIRPAS